MPSPPACCRSLSLSLSLSLYSLFPFRRPPHTLRPETTTNLPASPSLSHTLCLHLRDAAARLPPCPPTADDRLPLLALTARRRHLLLPMTRGGRSHGVRSRTISSMGSVGGPIDDSVGQDGTNAQVEESRTVDSRRELELETMGKERVMRPSNQCSRAITAIFKRYMHSTGFAWKKVLVERRMLYWGSLRRSLGGLILMRRCFCYSGRSFRTGTRTWCTT